MHVRPFIDSLDFARNRQQISGEISVVQLSRLLDVLDNHQNVLSYTIQGGVDDFGCALLDVGITGTCQLRCQRCLNSMDYAVQVESRLLLRDQTGLDALNDEEEAFDSILADAQLDVLDLLQDEILLSLPIAPKHQTGDCQVADGGSKAKEKPHPFAVLAGLKRH
jgi:uncharacterized protein